MKTDDATYFAKTFLWVVEGLVDAAAFFSLQHALLGDSERALRVEQHLLHDSLAFEQVLDLGIHTSHLVS